MTAHQPDPWREVTAARLPAAHLAALAPVRHRDGVRVVLAGEVAWAYWPAGRADVVRCLLPVPGAVFFARRAGLWFRFGSRVPTADAPPDAAGQAVAAVLVPARFEVVAPDVIAWEPVPLTVARGGTPKPATALACTVNELLAWADGATTAELAAVRGARSGSRAVLLGERLPAIPAATRFWGDAVLVPVGFRAEPALPDAALREAAGAAADEVLLLDERGAEVIPRAAFEPLTRAGVRLGAREP